MDRPSARASWSITAAGRRGRSLSAARSPAGALSGAALFLCLAACGGGGGESDGLRPAAVPPEIAALCTGWTDHPANPLLAPPFPEQIIADPTFLPPGQAPDGRWHLFAHAILTGVHHYTSEDGVAWTDNPPALLGLARIRPYLFREGPTYYLFYEALTDYYHSHIEVRTSADLFAWSEPTTVLEPEYEWERGALFTTGNPFLLKRDGAYWLYYSADGVFLHDALYFEPKYVGVARGPTPLGPFAKEPLPLIGPSAADPELNLGAGSIKLLDGPVAGRWVAFNNTIYNDADGNSRSAVRGVEQADGLAWEKACAAPVVAPEGDGWKRSFVYAFDVRPAGGALRMYYNARSGWFVGTERIGLASRALGP
ncbi:MAG: glycosyl hydrolase family 43 [Candidatus Methylomirabilis sp.]|nr:glycosyl hydrolase family 43 [Deltaproteobacteria bacterium]